MCARALERSDERRMLTARGANACRFWLLFDGSGRPLTLPLPGAGAAALPVFSFVEEAGMFLCLTPGSSSGLRIGKLNDAEMAALISDPALDFRCVALDPPGGSNLALARLVSIGRRDFLGLLRRRQARMESRPPPQRAAQT
jgi:hypothetical protein